MLISILVPIYKVEKYILKCLDSIFNQTYSDIEYVFVNDCTPDNSVQLLNSYIDANKIDRNKVKIISHSRNQGIAVTRNDCIENAKGEYVLFVDSDDWIEYDMIEQLVGAANGGEIDIVGCDYYDNFSDGSQVAHFENYALECTDNMVQCINYRIATALWKIMIRRSLFSKVHFAPEIEIGEDYVASIKLYYYARSFNCVHKCLYHYVKYNENRYSNMLQKSVEEHILAVNEVETFLKNVGFYNSKIEHELNLRKFGIKSYYLSKPMLDYEKWKHTYPESNKIWRYINYSKREKMKFWLAERHLFGILKILR